MTVTLYYLGVCVSGKGGWGFLDISMSVSLKLIHSIHIMAKSEKHIHNMTFYLYDCNSFNDLP